MDADGIDPSYRPTPRHATPNTTQGHRNLPQGLLDKHPSLPDNDAPATGGPVPAAAAPAPTTRIASGERTSSHHIDMSSGGISPAGGSSSSSSSSSMAVEGSDFSFSKVAHEALDRVAPEDVALLSHLGDSCALLGPSGGSSSGGAAAAGSSSGTAAGPAGGALAPDQRSLRERAGALEREAAAHAAAAAEAGRMAAAAAASAAALERRLQAELVQRRAQLLQQQEVRACVAVCALWCGRVVVCGRVLGGRGWARARTQCMRALRARSACVHCVVRSSDGAQRMPTHSACTHTHASPHGLQTKTPCQAQAASAELQRLSAARERLAGRIAGLRSELGSLVEQEQGLLSQQLEGERVRGCGVRARGALCCALCAVRCAEARCDGCVCSCVRVCVCVCDTVSMHMPCCVPSLHTPATNTHTTTHAHPHTHARTHTRTRPHHTHSRGQPLRHRQPAHRGREQHPLPGGPPGDARDGARRRALRVPVRPLARPVDAVHAARTCLRLARC
jgi:hypothetical protein